MNRGLFIWGCIIIIFTYLWSPQTPAGAAKPNSVEQKTSNSEAWAASAWSGAASGGSRVETKFFLSQTFIRPGAWQQWAQSSACVITPLMRWKIVLANLCPMKQHTTCNHCQASPTNQRLDNDQSEALASVSPVPGNSKLCVSWHPPPPHGGIWAAGADVTMWTSGPWFPCPSAAQTMLMSLMLVTNYPPSVLTYSARSLNAWLGKVSN